MAFIMPDPPALERMKKTVEWKILFADGLSANNKLIGMLNALESAEPKFPPPLALYPDDDLSQAEAERRLKKRCEDNPSYRVTVYGVRSLLKLTKEKLYKDQPDFEHPKLEEFTANGLSGENIYTRVNEIKKNIPWMAHMLTAWMHTAERNTPKSPRPPSSKGKTRRVYQSETPPLSSYSKLGL